MQITAIFAPVPSRKRGVAQRHETWGGMRWTRMVLWTTALEADGKDVWAWHPDAGVKFALRSADDGGQQARSTGAST